MEKSSKVKEMMHKLCTVCEILPFYGYTDENYYLLRQLSKVTRENLFNDLNFYIEHKFFSKMTDIYMIKGEGMSLEMAKRLVLSNQHLLHTFTLSIVTDEAHESLMYLLNVWTKQNKLTFKELGFSMKNEYIDQYNDIINLMIEKEYDLNEIDIYFETNPNFDPNWKIDYLPVWDSFYEATEVKTIGVLDIDNSIDHIMNMLDSGVKVTQGFWCGFDLSSNVQLIDKWEDGFFSNLTQLQLMRDYENKEQVSQFENIKDAYLKILLYKLPNLNYFELIVEENSIDLIVYMLDTILKNSPSWKKFKAGLTDQVFFSSYFDPYLIYAKKAIMLVKNKNYEILIEAEEVKIK